MKQSLSLSTLLMLSFIGGMRAPANAKPAQPSPNPNHNYALMALALASVFVKEQCNAPKKDCLMALMPSVITLGHMAHKGYVGRALNNLSWHSLKKNEKPVGTFLESASTIFFASSVLYKIWELNQTKPAYRNNSRRNSGNGFDSVDTPDADGSCSGGSCCVR